MSLLLCVRAKMSLLLAQDFNSSFLNNIDKPRCQKYWRKMQPTPLPTFSFSTNLEESQNSSVAMMGGAAAPLCPPWLRYWFELIIEVCFENDFGLIHTIFLSLWPTKSVYLFLGHAVLGTVLITTTVLSYFFIFSDIRAPLRGPLWK